MSASITALVAFVAWTLVLLVGLAGTRVYMVLSGRKQPHEFDPDGGDLPGFPQRITRAQANCVENLPLFGGLILAAAATGQTAITDPAAMWFVYARIGQSVVHLIRVNPVMVNIRFALYGVQLAIMIYYAWQLLLA